MNREFDVVVLGAGHAGYSAAMHCLDLNAKVALIDDSKTWRSSRTLDWARHVLRESKDLIFEEFTSLCLQENKKYRDQQKNQFCERGGLWLDGVGKVIGKNEIQVTLDDNDEVLKTKSVIVATGSEVIPEISFPLDGEICFDESSIWSRPSLPDKLLITGGGKSMAEYAHVFKQFGSKVFVVHDGRFIVDDLDPRLLEAIEENLKKNKIKLLLDKKISSLYKNDNIIDVTLTDAVKFSVDAVLCLGKISGKVKGPFSGNSSPVSIDEQAIAVNEKMETSETGIYSAGSVVGSGRSSSRSVEQGRIAAGNACGKKRSLKPELIPWTLKTDVEFASVGLRAEEAHHHGFRAIEHKEISPLFMSDEKKGNPHFLILVAEKKTGELLGAQCFSEHAISIIGLIHMALKKKFFLKDLVALVGDWDSSNAWIRECARAMVESTKGNK